MARLDFRNWIPSRVYLNQGPASVDWVYFDEPRYREAFLFETLELAMRRPFNLLFRRNTPLDAMEEWERQSPGIAPTGFIFHVSRCGSTLLVNLLGGLPGTLMLSEPAPLLTLIRARLTHPEISEERQIAWIRAMVSALAQRRLPGQDRLFIKFDAWDILFLPLIRKAFPEVPWVFLFREPVEVLVSLCRMPAGQMFPSALTPILFGIDAVEAAQMPFEEYSARVLGTLYRAGLDGFDPERSALVDYSQLPAAAWNEVAGAFGLDLSEEAVADLQKRSHWNPKGNAVFTPDSEKKRKEAGEKLYALARQWVQPAYEELRKAAGAIQPRSPG